jgi:hypothetical protein
VNAILQLAELPWARLTRTPRAWIPIGAWSLFALGAALVLHHTSPSASANDALEDVFGAVALPLLAYGVVGAALGGDSLARGARSLVAFGASASRASLAEVLVAAAASALLASVVGVLVAVLGHGPSDPPLAGDALTTGWIAALGGATYASFFTLGASFGKRGGGRTWFLALDWLFGASHGAVAFATPRAHVRSLLGGVAVASCSNAQSTAMLVVLALVFGSAAIARTRRA